MSNAPSSSDPSNDDATVPSLRVPPVSIQRVTTALRTPLRAVAFWSATMLPLAYLPLLAFGLDNRRRAGAFVVLLAAHAIALVVGRSYRTE